MGREVCRAWHDHFLLRVVTFKKATDIQEAARELPLDKILVETDAPYLAPVLNGGSRKQNSLYSLCSGLYRRLAWYDDRRAWRQRATNAEQFLDWTASNERKNFSSHRG